MTTDDLLISNCNNIKNEWAFQCICWEPRLQEMRLKVHQCNNCWKMHLHTSNLCIFMRTIFFQIKKTKKGYRINHYINVWLKSECQLSDHNGDLSSQDVNMQTVLFFYYDQWRKKKERIAREPSSPETWCKIHCSAEHQLEGKQRSDGAPDGSLLFFIHELAPYSFTWFLRRW